MKVSVSVLGSYNSLISSVRNINNSSADFIHIDVMDGKFVEDKKFPKEVVKDLKLVSKKPLDVHLMVNDLSTIKEYALLKPDYLTFHIEVINDKKIIEYVKSLGIKVGLAINPETNVKKIFPYINDIDLVLFMSVVPGKGGQAFMEDVMDKIGELKKYTNKGLIISVDGGVNDRTVRICKHVGANMVVSGSFITNSNNYEDKIKQLR